VVSYRDTLRPRVAAAVDELLPRALLCTRSLEPSLPD
jgi:hypothetical protein